MAACGNQERPAPAKGKEPGLPPALPQSDMNPDRPTDDPVEQQTPWWTAVGGPSVGHPEIAQRDDEHGEPPAPPCRHQAQAGRHRREIEEEQFGIALITAQQDGREEGAQRSGGSQRLDIDGVRDHGKRHGDQRQTKQAGRRRQDAVQSRRRPDAEVDDRGPAADQCRTVGPVA